MYSLKENTSSRQSIIEQLRLADQTDDITERNKILEKLPEII